MKVRDVACSHVQYQDQPCGAKPGEPCSEWSNGPRVTVPYYHAERVDDALSKLSRESARKARK